MYSLAEIAGKLAGELHGDPELAVTGVGAPDCAEAGQAVVAFNDKALDHMQDTLAAAVVVPAGMSPEMPHITVADPKAALRTLQLLFAPPLPAPSGVHKLASVDPSAKLGKDLSVAAFAVIEADVQLGDRCRIGAHCVVGAGAQLGDDVVLHPNTTLYPGVRLGNRVVVHSGTAIGGNGYGMYLDGDLLRRIPQLGSVIIGDDVEIGCNCCVDRATLGFTRVKRGTKIDNQVQIAHNCTIGENCIIAGQCGIAGSSTLGDFVVLAGQAGAGDHVEIGDRVTLTAQCAVFKNQKVDPGVTLKGNPGIPLREYNEIHVLLRKLRELFKRVDKLERGQGGDP
jgi:UDP-3-O-[3-hydroxymyristoyl] glucosamine N-acyltransferase